jgi:peptidoglycan/LPS O-acetylase OafA/YrhL
VGLYFWGPKTHYLLTFLGGIAASFLVRIEAFRKFAATRVATVLLVGCLAADVYTFASADGIVQLLLLSAAFCLIAGGNSIFGILVSPVSRTLGEMAYSIYLLHGMILFVTFTLIMGTENVKSLSPTTYWLLVIGISPILIMISYCTFRLIEQPGMQSKDAVTAWLRSRIAGGRAPA